jgi:hypothetical protein
MSLLKINPADFGVVQNIDVNYEDLQKELEKAKPYLKLPWGTMQTNDLDRITKFIYTTPSLEELINQYEILKKTYPTMKLGYIIHRWYNHQTSKMAERLFCSFGDIVKAEQNQYHKKIDFYIYNEPFDLKLTVMPKEFFQYNVHEFKNRNEKKNELITWLYQEQSQEGRFHTSNRLFLVLRGDSPKANNLQSKELKCRFDLIEDKIKTYLTYISYKRQNNHVDTFNRLTINVRNETHKVYSDALILHI